MAGSAASLPVQLGAFTRAGQRGPLPEASDSSFGRFHARILVAEDNAVNQVVTTAMLEAIGCEVQVVETASWPFRDSRLKPSISC